MTPLTLLKLLIAGVFIAAALAKLVAVPALVTVYDQIGIGQWFRYATILVELVGTFGVLSRRHVAAGALLLAATMLVAALLCIFVLRSNPVPAFILSALCLWLAAMTRQQLAPFFRKRPKADNQLKKGVRS